MFDLDGQGNISYEEIRVALGLATGDADEINEILD